MRPLTFLISSVLGFILLACFYAVVVDRFVIQERKLPFVFYQYLLEASSSVQGKVVIESGSNALHGIDTFALSEYFQAPTIIIADNASYPLRNKIVKLRKHLSSGDVVILPLEWRYYSRPNELPEAFLTSLADENLSLEYYYNELPVAERLRFLFTKYPVHIALDALLTRFIVKQTPVWDRYLMTNLYARLKRGDNESYGSIQLDEPELVTADIAERTCDQYIAPHSYENEPYAISDTFRSNLALLQGLAASGISIYFSWPSIVDSHSSECLSTRRFRRKMNLYSKEIMELVQSKGFKFIGDLKSSHFTSECFLDTYYHLRTSCATERTKRLIDGFLQAGVKPIGSSLRQADLNAVTIAYSKDLKRELFE